MLIKLLIPVYLKNLQILGRSYYTIRKAKYGLAGFAKFLNSENVFHIEELSTEVMEEY